jgi:hypothetical protein
MISENITRDQSLSTMIPKGAKMSVSASSGPVPVSNEQPGKKSKARAKSGSKSKPTKMLPTTRISVAKQLDILRAYAAASGKGTKPATTEEAGEIVKMAATTVVMANAFLCNAGLLKRSGTGSYLPSTEVIDFLGAWDWDQKTASHKLGPCLRRTWFAEALLPRISYGAIDEKDAVTVLADAAKATPDKEKELRMLIEFLVAGGVVQGEGGQIRLAKSTASIDPVPTRPEEQKPLDTDTSVRSGRVTTAYAAQAPGGGVDFNISVHVDMKEFGDWRPDRITAFFRGIAEVLSAKADVEKGGAGS